MTIVFLRSGVTAVFDATIGLDRGDSISLKLEGGSVFVHNDNGRVSISVMPEREDILQVYVDEETCEIMAVTSPNGRIEVPLKSWQETLRMLGQ